MSKKQLLVSVLSLFYLFNLNLDFFSFFFKSVILKGKSYFHNLNQIFIFDFLFTFSYSLLIILNRSGLFNIIPSHDDENRAEFFNRAHCFRYLNRINPSFAMIEKVHLDDLDLYVVTSAVVATSVFL